MLTEAQFVEAVESSIEGMSGKLTAEVEFRTVDGWDSLAMLFLLNTVDAEMGVQLDAVTIGNCRTLKEVYNKALESAV
ncbi:MAG: hypothetical protein LR015_01700 [Verrucomicrobia bacterium]|nr:hypothetical protein [Verrucomicrobiota bacterium]